MRATRAPHLLAFRLLDCIAAVIAATQSAFAQERARSDIGSISRSGGASTTDLDPSSEI